MPGSSSPAARLFDGGIARRAFPLALLLPVTFVAGEFLRLLGPLGVPTGLLALSFHERLWMIQIADLGGIYLVSFAIASVNGALADRLSRRRAVARRAFLLSADAG